MNILVMGAGAMGSAVGGFMAMAGHEVTLVGRALHINAIAQRGLHISGIWGEYRTSNLHTAVSIDLIPSQQFDLIFIAVKSYDTEKAVISILPLLTGNTLVCSYQNGLGNAEMIANHVGWERTLGARVIYGVRITDPGAIEITVIAEPTAIGAYHNAVDGQRVRVAADAMNEAKLPTVYSENIQTLLWNKVAYNCALNPLSALLDVPYGELSKSYYTRKVMNDVVGELYTVAHAKKISLEPDSHEGYMTRFYEKLLPPTAAHYASMREDLRQGRRTEIDALNGAITRFGAEHSLSCPVNALLTALIHARETSSNQAHAIKPISCSCIKSG